MRVPIPLAIAAIAAFAASTPAPASSAGGLVAGDTDSLALSKPSVAPYGRRVWMNGALVPGRAGVSVDLVRGGIVVASAQTQENGSFSFGLRLQSPGPYVARSGKVKSAPVTARIRPTLRASIQGVRIVGQPLVVRGRLQPSGAGKLRLVVVRGHRRIVSRVFASGKHLTLTLSRARRHVAWVEVVPKAGFTKIARKFRFFVGAPQLHQSSRGHDVRLLERELVAHRFALSNVDSIFGYDTLEAVYALQKMARLPRTGTMSIATWLALSRLEPPRPRLRGDYIDIDKTRQVLFVFRKGRAVLIVPVSTGATGNTPIGTFHVYSKVPGGAVMYYSNYFTGGFAIHGYVFVPPYPASHGCVRVPMCFAIRLYGLIPLGGRVYIHY
jgi:N-acetylmuramoyl-L-alanine amidase